MIMCRELVLQPGFVASDADKSHGRFCVNRGRGDISCKENRGILECLKYLVTLKGVPHCRCHEHTKIGWQLGNWDFIGWWPNLDLSSLASDVDRHWPLMLIVVYWMFGYLVGFSIRGRGVYALSDSNKGWRRNFLDL